MDLAQIKGPFYRNQRVTIPSEAGYKYVHIGIQIPKRQPIAVPATRVSNNGKVTTLTGEWRNQYPSNMPNISLTINDILYQVNANDILEFDGLSEVTWTIQFNQAMPAETIIDVVRSS